MNRPQRILYVTTDLAWPLSFGGEIRKWNLLQGLIQAAPTDVLVFRDLERPLAHEAFSGCGQVHQISRSHLDMSPAQERLYRSTIGRGVLAFGSTLPFEYLGSERKRFQSDLSQRVDWSTYDLVWITTGRCATALGGALDGHTTILDGDDFSYVRNLGLLRSSGWYGAKLWNYLDVAKMWWHERRFAARYSYVVRCSAEDRDRHPAKNVIVIPNGTAIPPRPQRSPGPNVLFVGDLGYQPNREGVEWLLGSVWPLVRQRVPEAELKIVGRNPSDRIQASSGSGGVAVLGFVDSLAAHYASAALSVVPILAGGGTRLKVLESLAYAVPIVSTTIGTFGIDADQSLGVYHADGAQAFADKCVELLTAPTGASDRQALAGREMVRSRYDWRAIQGQVAALSLEAAGQREHHPVALRCSILPR
jgi:glycosyltransferase involved in cell wall biosynthesis